MKEWIYRPKIVAEEQEEQKMRPHLVELTTQIQHALLETAEQWLAPLYEQCDDLEFICACYEALGYRPRSAVTGQLYESCADLDEAEPETLDFSWVTPEPQVLRERLHTMPAEQLYYQVIDLAGQKLSQQSFAWDWGTPPDNQNTGETFLPSLLGYLMLRKEAATLPTEQFERTYREQLEALAVPAQEVEEEPSQEEASCFPHMRLWHFRLVLTPANQGQQHALPHLKNAFVTSSDSTFGKAIKVSQTWSSPPFLPLLPLQHIVSVAKRDAHFR